jgi:serine/threonine protein phosphatase PrpC
MSVGGAGKAGPSVPKVITELENIPGKGDKALEALSTLQAPTAASQVLDDRFDLQLRRLAQQAGRSGPAAERVTQNLNQTLQLLTKIFKDRRITDNEFLALGRAKDCLDDVASLLRPEMAAVVPKEIFERMRGPIEDLKVFVTVADGLHSRRMVSKLEPGVRERLKLSPREQIELYQGYHLLNPTEPFNSVSRYADGDIVPVLRSDGVTKSHGQVIGFEPNGDIRAAFFDEAGGFCIRPVSDKDLEASPLKPGDYIGDAPPKGMGWDAGPGGSTREVWVLGVNKQGKLFGLAETPDGRQSDVTEEELKQLATVLRIRRQRQPAQAAPAASAPETQPMLVQKVAAAGSTSAAYSPTEVVDLASVQAAGAKQESGPTPDQLALQRALELAGTAPISDELTEAERVVNMTTLSPTEAGHYVFAGGPNDVHGIQGFNITGVGSVAMFSYKGIGYETYNEDVGLIYFIPAQNGRGPFIVKAVADQAGAHKKIEGRDGAASQIACAALFTELAAAVGDGFENVDLAQLVLDAAHRGNDKIRQLNERIIAAHLEEKGELETCKTLVTTFCTSIVDLSTGIAYGNNVGDSKRYRFSAEGEFREESKTDNQADDIRKEKLAREGIDDVNAGIHVSNVITAALDGEPIKRPIKPHPHQSKLEKGDWEVIVTDGSDEANLHLQQWDVDHDHPWKELSHSDVTKAAFGEILRTSNTVEEATQRIVNYVLAQQDNGCGKPDNLTVIVQRLDPKQ